MNLFEIARSLSDACDECDLNGGAVDREPATVQPEILVRPVMSESQGTFARSRFASRRKQPKFFGPKPGDPTDYRDDPRTPLESYLRYNY